LSATDEMGCGILDRQAQIWRHDLLRSQRAQLASGAARKPVQVDGESGSSDM